MKLPLKRAALSFLVLSFYLPTSFAAGGLNFSGFYEFGDVTDLGQELRLELKLEIINHTGVDVSGANLIVRDGLFSNQTFHSWDSLVLFRAESVRLTSSVTVPRKVFENWLRSGGPRILMEYTDAQGDSKTTLVRLISRRGVED